MRGGTVAIGLLTIGISDHYRFRSADDLGNLLKSFIGAVKMTPIGVSRIQLYPAAKKNDMSGMTILQCLKESHASLETYPELGLVEMMISSCRTIYPLDIIQAFSPYEKWSRIVDSSLMVRTENGWTMKSLEL